MPKTAESNEDEIQKFYEDVTRARTQCKEHEVIIVMGDLNAKVGKGRYKDIVGEYGLGTRNDRGNRFVEWCLQSGQIITSTWFIHHQRRLWTWKSPGDRFRNQIDYITINRRFRNAAIQTRTYPGADCNSDHVPVVSNIKVTIKKPEKIKTNPVKQIELLRKDNELQDRYRIEVNNRYDLLNEEEDSDAQQQWNNLQQSIEKGMEIVPKKERRNKKPWMNEDILNLMDERSKYKKINLNRTIHNLCIEAKERWVDERCIEVE